MPSWLTSPRIGRSLGPSEPVRAAAWQPETQRLLARFWQSASGFWRRPNARWAWTLVGILLINLLAQLYVQYRMNFWNRDFFDAIGLRDRASLILQTLIFIPLAVASLLGALVSIWARMTMQRSWRDWLSQHLYEFWLGQGRAQRLHLARGGYSTPEYRIADDARIATDLPIDLVLGFISAILSAGTFIGVLWTVGKELDVTVLGARILVPGYLVFAVVAYSALVTGATMLIGRHLMEATAGYKHAEAELREVGARLRERCQISDTPAVSRAANQEIAGTLAYVIGQWRTYCWQCVRMTLVSHANFLLTPFIAILVCMPKYMAGVMSLGELVQAAAAFAVVHGAFNWFADSYGRIAEWVSSANRVASLLIALDEAVDEPSPPEPLG
jgi:vitamin B12/bleomycin/antimicrobial peptide transport system ATP-binding/permease protein